MSLSTVPNIVTLPEVLLSQEKIESIDAHLCEWVSQCVCVCEWMNEWVSGIQKCSFVYNNVIPIDKSQKTEWTKIRAYKFWLDVTSF